MLKTYKRTFYYLFESEYSCKNGINAWSDTVDSQREVAFKEACE